MILGSLSTISNTYFFFQVLKRLKTLSRITVKHTLNLALTSKVIIPNNFCFFITSTPKGCLVKLKIYYLMT